MMKNTLELILNLTIPSLVLLHLLIAPYTKVEESFNIQATHDILTYSSLPGSLLKNLRFFDHIDFPGAVPRSFIGALALSIVAKPIVFVTGIKHAQFVARAALGLFNAFAMLRYKSALAKAYGEGVGVWYLMLQATQFHVIFYASRTLPNMFAFGLTTMALASFLPTPTPRADRVDKLQKRGIFLFVLAGIIFRGEVALLLAMQLIHLLILPRMSLQQMIPAGFKAACVALALSVPIDSFFWQKPLWPELWGFYYNAVQGNSSEWGTSPYGFYFSSALPRLLLNPLMMMLLLPLAFLVPTIQRQARDLIIPSLLFIAVYSLQPHKESRFIIYVVPPLTGAAAIAANYIWRRRNWGVIYDIGIFVTLMSVLTSFVASTAMLFISSLNYPGGEAITSVKYIITHAPEAQLNTWEPIHVHMDVLSCMTGVTRFQEISHPRHPSALSDIPIVNGIPSSIIFSKEENATILLDPAFWDQFDYALMEAPGRAIGKWEVVDTIYAYAGLEFLKPGQDDRMAEHMEDVYAADNLTVDGGVAGSEDVKEAVGKGVDKAEFLEWKDLKGRWRGMEMSRREFYLLVKDAVRLFTGGYWIGPRMKPAIRILKRVKETAV